MVKNSRAILAIYSQAIIAIKAIPSFLDFHSSFIILLSHLALFLHLPNPINRFLQPRFRRRSGDAGKTFAAAAEPATGSNHQPLR